MTRISDFKLQTDINLLVNSKVHFQQIHPYNRRIV